MLLHVPQTEEEGGVDGAIVEFTTLTLETRVHSKFSTQATTRHTNKKPAVQFNIQTGKIHSLKFKGAKFWFESALIIDRM